VVSNDDHQLYNLGMRIGHRVALTFWLSGGFNASRSAERQPPVTSHCWLERV